MAKILQAIKEPVGRLAVKHIRLHAPEWLARITRRRGRRAERLFCQSGGGFDRNIPEPGVVLGEHERLTVLFEGFLVAGEDRVTGTFQIAG